MKRLLLVCGGAIALLFVILITRTLMLGGGSEDYTARTQYDGHNGQEIAQRLGQSIQYETISWGDEREPDAEAFQGFAEFLKNAYPNAHRLLQRETVNDHSLLYRWPGSDSSLKPVGFIAHIDVVPIETGTEDQWTYAPFSGRVEGGAVWGRGALDNKGQIITIMEAVEKLAAENFQPTRDIYLMFGHDEEVGGPNGAAAISDLLKSRGVTFEWTLDEGSGLVSGVIPGVSKPVALIATAEKGSTTLRLTATAPGGHSSTPLPDTAVSLVSRAIVNISDNPHPLKIDKNTVSFIHAIAPELPFMQRMVMANLWLTGPFVKSQLEKDRVTAASLHTTTAPTIINGGTKLNILPQQASAIVNYRIHPRDSVEDVRKRAEQSINDPNITIETIGATEPSPRATTKSEGYRAIAQVTGEIFGPIPTAPFLTLQGTDTKHYTGIANANYRFTPFIYESDDLKRIHGTDEYAKIENLARAAAWYEALIRKSAGTP
ncbi:MAG: peptidase M20 [Hyphococcus sp.]|nr:MAG: peptidase M20 [Marinicaulis sp.]